MFRELRRKSLQLDIGGLDKLKSERRGSLSDKAVHQVNHLLQDPSSSKHHEKDHRRGSLVTR